MRVPGGVAGSYSWVVVGNSQGDIFEGACVRLINDDTCGKHAVTIGCASDRINTTCYQVSNDSDQCGQYDAPSFFDRLDGRLYMDRK